ncbi:MAG TPA: Rne/Rng family ribonuclease [Candidatus Tidjanibacter faecipullorum]|uniref:Rne/Rng family ribonuclease n=1 Tax=Candidatus Tidjanibacter faecipullorum TaxID=2838766 RepID=A0A9D2DEG5_9BACT|nr:Rne/Rng family ribonuclease [Candidatus Tidjanibacter faecipullorum]
MNRELIINVTKSEITIALAEDKQLVELNKESVKTGFAVGDIYFGRVRKIMPGLNAAFVNIGHEKDAFIHYLDLGPQFASLQKLVGQLLGPKRNNVRFDTFKLEQPIGKTGKIGNLLTTGQPIMVQVAKEAISTKGPRLTADISLAGRNVVLIPFSNKISISQKIRSAEERKRLKKIVSSVLPKNYGVIVRTAAQGKNDADIEQDVRSLITRWEGALENVKTLEPPALLLGEMNRATTILRDSLNGTFSTIAVDDKEMYDAIREYIRVISPEQEKIVKLYKGKVSILDNYDMSRQIKSLFSKYVSLKRGAYLIIEHTEAMNVIDVNSGNRAKVADDQESTAMDVNLMAAAEIARQLRLRDMGGQVVIDFIDLHKAENRQKLYKTMQELMAGDKAKHTILPLSKFGLMQITRQRVRPEAIEHVEEVCPMCGGTGKMSTTVSIERELENLISYYAGEKKIRLLKLLVSPYVSAYLKRGFPSVRLRWMFKYRFRLIVRVDQSLGMVEYKFLDRKNRQLL